MKCYIWYVTCKCDTWHMTCDTWHMTCDTWNVSSDTWREVNLLSKFQGVWNIRLWSSRRELMKKFICLWGYANITHNNLRLFKVHPFSAKWELLLKKKTWGWTLSKRARGVKEQSKFVDEPFWCLSLNIFLGRKWRRTTFYVFGTFYLLKFGNFPKKGVGIQIQIYWGTFIFLK